jgi:tetratricopeptide (TPR) repeat protein
VFVGRERELSELTGYAMTSPKPAPLSIIAPAGMGKTALLDAAILSLPGDVRVARLGARPFSTPMEVVRGIFKSLGGDFDSEFGCGFSEVLVLAGSGLVAARASKLGAEHVDDDIFGGMLNAVRSFVEDSFGRAGGRGLGRLEYEDLKIIIRSGNGFSLVGIVSGPESPSMIEEMGNVVKAIESGAHGRVDSWKGAMVEMAGIERLAQGLLERRWPIPGEYNREVAQDLTKIAEVLVELAASSLSALIVIEDVHWLSHDQRSILAHFARGIEGTRIGLIVTSRPFDGDAKILAPFERIGLPPLNAAEISGLAAEDAGSAGELERISGGNPLFLKELLRLGDLRGISQGTTLEGLISERIHSLNHKSLAACEIASAMGARFDVHTFESVLGKAGLEALADADFIAIDGEEGYFSHALYHSAVYDSMSQFRLSHVHDSLAKAVPAGDVFSLARHSLIAGRDASCIEIGVKAGDLARDGRDHEVAAWYYDKVLARSKRFIMDENAKAGVIGKETEALLAIGETAKAKDLLGRHLPTFGREARGRLLVNSANVAWVLCDYDEALVAAREAQAHPLDERERAKMISITLDITMKRGDPQKAIDMAVAHRNEFPSGSLSHISLLLQVARGKESVGDYAGVRAALDEAFALAEKSGDRQSLCQVENQLGIHLVRVGKLDEALTHHDKSESLAHELKMLRLEVHSLVNKGNVYMMREEYEKAFKSYKMASVIARRAGYRDAEGSAIGNIGNILMNERKFAEGLDYFKNALEIFESLGNTQRIVYTLWSIAECCAGMGEREKGTEIAQRAMDLSVNAKSKVDEAWSWYIIGIVRGETGDIVTARESLKIAVTAYAKLGSASENALIHSYWARLEAKIGDPETALREMAEAAKLYRQDGIEYKATEIERVIPEELRFRVG